MPKIPLNPFLSWHPSDSLGMIAQGLKLVSTVLATAGDDNIMLAGDEYYGLSYITHALGEAVRYESERYPDLKADLKAGRDGPIAVWNAAVGD